MRRLALACALALLLAPRWAWADAAVSAPHVATAFFYGPKPPPEILEHYTRVVLEPDHFATLPRARAQLFAYVSLGEVNRGRSWYADVPKRLFLGQNPSYRTDVVDTSSAEWRAFVLDRVIEPLWAKGFRGFFFDTLDSFLRVVDAPADIDKHLRGIAQIVASLKQRHADAQILLNRGFDVLPFLPPGACDGLVVESVFQTADPVTSTYRAVPKEESDAILKRIQDTRAKWRSLPIAIIDYVAPKDGDLRRRDALRIWQLGYDPWVTVPSLDGMGIGRLEIVPRTILLLHRSDGHGYLGVQDACVLIAPILEWLGYRVDYHDVRKPLPRESLVGRYAGIVTLLPDGVDHESAFRQWLLSQIDQGMRVAFFEGFGFHPDAAFLSRLGLSPAQATAKAPMRIASSTPFVGFEAPARAHLRERPPVTGPSAYSMLRLEDAEKSTWDGVIVAPWGGVAFSPYVIEERLDEERRWVLDPFRFVSSALALPAIPVPDVTTESGRRIFTTHIDGDGFVSRAERHGAPYTAQVLLEEVLKKYPVPHTISVVEGEVGPKGLYPKESPALEKIAREIFQLPHVELASHTFSHPFEWEDAEAGHKGPPLPHLPIPGYTFDLERDLKGSIDYINSRLAPPGKKVQVMLWSGNCSPSERAVAMTQALGVFNVNGGGATRMNDTPSFARGSPMGIPEENGAYQVFAPVENENVYTNDWHGPYYGYRRAVETFELTDKPRRVGILTIYYHFYSAAKTASLVALKEVYDWALKQETTPLYLSEYAAKVMGFQSASLARRIDDGAWEIGGLGELQTVRMPTAAGWPDMARSQGIAGVRDAPQGRYVTLVKGARVVIAQGAPPPAQPELESANGRVLKWEPTPSGAKIRVRGYVPLVVQIGGTTKACTLQLASGANVQGARVPGGTRFALAVTDTGEATVDCR